MSKFEQYRGESGKNYHNIKHEIDNESVKLIYGERKKKLQPYIKHTDIVLEYGAGCGWNIIPINCRYKYAYDVSEHLRDVYSAYSDIVFFENFDDVSNQSFDVIICHHVLEHLDNPVGSLSEIRSVLSHNGKLILCIPFEYQRRFKRCANNDNDHHLYSWNMQTICNLVESCDYEIEEAKIRDFGYERISAFKFGCYGYAIYRLSISVLRLIRPVKEIMIVAKRKNG